jgi:hypothetical protein
MRTAIGLTICRLSLDTSHGAVRHRTQVGIAIRAGLFVDLTLAGRLRGDRWPSPVDSYGAAVDGTDGATDPEGEDTAHAPMTESLLQAVLQRGPTNWKRWYSHTGADVDGAVRALTRDGRFRADPAGRLSHDEPDRIAELILRVTAVMEAAPAGGPIGGRLGPLATPGVREAPSTGVNLADAAVALLATAAGMAGQRPHPRQALARLNGLLPNSPAAFPMPFDVAGRPTAAQTVRAAVRAAMQAARRQSGIRFLSG